MSLTRRDAGNMILGAAAASLLPSAALGRRAPRAFMFAYFEHSNKAEPGLRFAASEDGLAYEPLRGGRRFLIPQVGEAKLMRDPFLFQGPGRRWHMLWTTAWEGVTIGHASSADLINWSPQQAIPVMAGTAGTRNCWAPEAVWDPVRKHYVIVWSSTVTGAFPETAGSSENAYNHRLYCTTTRDFRTFGATRLFYDPGFSVIDATFFNDPAGRLHMIVKDETVKPPKKHLRIARAFLPLGRFGTLSPALPGTWVEGPSAINLGRDVVIFYDRYLDKKYGAVRSRDLKTWEDISERIRMPARASHGTIVLVDRALIEALR
jgi:hypothetical protein